MDGLKPSESSEPLSKVESNVDNAPRDAPEAVTGESGAAGTAPAPAKSTSRKRLYIGLGVVALIIVVLAVVIPVVLTVGKKKTGDDSGSGSDDSTTDGGSDEDGTSAEPTPTKAPVPKAPTFGGDGSEVTLANGTTFIYSNPFGGYWVQDPENPFNNDARPNNWTPPLNTTWRWGVDQVQGVNLGGWFVLEPFITPAIFQKYDAAVDEYTLTEAMRAAGTLNELEEHYENFITELDIAEIAGAGLNWLRIPLGYWAIETYDNEPYLERTSWHYFVRVLEWARKYGLRVYLDLHAIPGSQNAMNHSGRLRRQAFLRGPMGIANAQRTLYYLRVLTQFVSQPEWQPVVQIIGLVNEPESRVVPPDLWQTFYLEAYRVIREVTGFGEGNGPYIAVGDGFRRPTEWAGMMPNADRFIMDVHPYMAFDSGPFRTDPLTTPAADGLPGGRWPVAACERWGGMFNDSRRAIGVTVGAEFSGAINDCGLFMRAKNVDSAHPQCPLYNNWESWSDSLKAGLQNFILASFDAIGDFYWWTWKVGPSQAGRVETPFWSYQLGLRNGWIPRDPRVARGKCQRLGYWGNPFDGNFRPHQTGANPSPTIPAAYSSAHQWPPTSIPNAEGVPLTRMPMYTTGGAPITLPVPTFTGAPASATEGVDGWANDNDVAPAVTPRAGCTYPDLYETTFAVVPTAAFCT